MTEKLYYRDSHMTDFTARVLDCREMKNGWALILDRTAFFPEGGGQAADTGCIGAVHVTDMHERNGEILHCCDAPLPAGTEVDCRIDAEQRFRRMQNHSGEHIVSGIAHTLYGCENVGFHMAECMTIDFDRELEAEQLAKIETLANQTVRANLPIRAWFPEPEELKTLEYRSKLELTENVRIVEIEGIDRCACCAPHVSFTGEVGVIKLLGFERHRGGVRIDLVCGMDALDDYRQKQQSVTDISRLLSAKRHEVSGAVERVLAEQQKQKEHIASLSMELVRYRAAAFEETDGNICVFDEVLDEPALRELVNVLMEKCGGIAAAFSGNDEEGYRYIIGSRSIDLRKAGREINAAIGGRGGGSSQMIQGRAAADMKTIRKAIMDELYRQNRQDV